MGSETLVRDGIDCPPAFLPVVLLKTAQTYATNTTFKYERFRNGNKLKMSRIHIQ